MKIVLGHAYYMQRGGEDCIFEEERDLLRAHGHDVVDYSRRNEALASMNPLAAAAKTVWNRQAAHELADILRREQPDVVHFTNTFPLISPAACHVAARSGAAVLQSLHNYRLLCAGGKLMRDGNPCHDCVGRAFPFSALKHRCYRDSRGATAAVVAMQLVHRALGTWRRKVDGFLFLTEFTRDQFIDAGFPADRLHVKHNAVYPDPGPGAGEGGYAMFAGRLSPEKGIAVMLKAWRDNPRLPALKIAGDGDLTADVQAAASRDPRIHCLGRLPEAEVVRLIGGASVVVVPSVWYETFGRTIAEAYSRGTPVVASRIGAMVELVREGETGWLATPGDAQDLAAHVERLQAMPATDMAAMRRQARTEFERRFTPQAGYDRLMHIYERAIEAARQRLSRPSRSCAPQTAPARGVAAAADNPAADSRLTPAQGQCP